MTLAQQLRPKSPDQIDPQQAPKTDDELHRYIKTLLGYDIARKPVCSHHDAPFTPLADLFFDRTHRALVVASRGSGKTLLTSILEFLLATFNPNYHIFHSGAIDEQARRGYEYLRTYIHSKNINPAPNYPIVDPSNSIMSQTRWKNGSLLEIHSATLNQTSGAHPHLKVGDELERWKPEVYQQFIGMGTTANLKTLFISTRERAYGLVQTLIDESHRRDITVYNFCVWETKEPCLTCPQDACPIYAACLQKYQHSSGHRSVKNIADKFLLSDFETWKTQQLCEIPGSQGLCFPNFHAIPSNESNQSNVNPLALYNPDYPIELWCDDNTAQPRAILAVQQGFFAGIERIWAFQEYYEKGRLQSQSVKEVLERLPQKPEVAIIPQEALELKLAFHAEDIPTLHPKNYRRVEGTSIVNRFIQDVHGRKLFILHPSCQNAIRSLQKHHRAEIAPDIYGEEPVKTPDDHFADAVAYGLFLHKYGLE